MTTWQRLVPNSGLAAFAVAMATLTAQDPSSDANALALRVRDASREPLARCTALARLHELGTLETAVFVDALTAECEPLRAIAARIARHAVLEWPVALVDAVSKSPMAAVAVLHELALAPRPSLEAMVTVLAERGDGPVRLLALAARTAPLSRKEAEFVVRELARADDRTAQLAVQRLEPAVADALVTTLHAILVDGAPLSRVLPVFERLSPLGVRQLLGLAGTLEPSVAAEVVDFLFVTGNEEIRSRFVDGLDRGDPLPASWIRRAGPWLDTDQRRNRVAALLTSALANPDDAAAQELAIAAFAALLEASVYVPQMAEFARAGGRDRFRLLFDRPLRLLPDHLIVEQLAPDGGAELDALSALSRLAQQRRSLSQPIESAVMDLAKSRVPSPAGHDPIYDAALRVLCQSSDAGVAMALELAATESRRMVAVCEHLAHRRDPIGASALRVLLQRTPEGFEPDRELRRMILLLLAENGDRAEATEVVRSASSLRSSFVHRARLAWPSLDDAGYRDLLGQLSSATDDETRIELLLWLAPSALPEVRAALQQVRVAHEVQEVREAALEALLRGPLRAALVAEHMAAESVDADHDESFAYAAMSSMATPMTDADATLMQWLLFTAPRRDQRERLRAAKFGDGRAGFPVVAGIAAHLRREPERAASICGFARELAANGDTEGLLRQRFLFLWTALQAEPALRIRVGRATAALVLAIPDAEDRGRGPASYYMAYELGDQQRYREGAAMARTAFARLLLEAESQVDVRIHLGVRDKAVHVDAHAALAALPHLYLAHDASRSGDATSARAHLLHARELAGSDRAVREAIETLEKSLP